MTQSSADIGRLHFDILMFNVVSDINYQTVRYVGCHIV